MSLVVFLCLAGATIATAQQQSGEPVAISAGIGPQVGFFKSQDGDDIRLMGGAAARIKLGRALGVEGSINYRVEEYHKGRIQATSWPVMVTGLVYPFPALYGAIGAGWYNTTIDYKFPIGVLGGPLERSVTQQDFGWHFGGGLEVPVGSAGRIVADIRYVFLDYDFQTLPGVGGVTNDFYVITASFLFGLQ
jgi:opacity protein-like surface antigen